MKALRTAVVFAVCASLLGAAPRTTLRGYSAAGSDIERRYESQFLDLPSAQGALDAAVAIGAHPHYAGSEGDYQLARYMRDKMREYGLDADLETFTTRVDTPKKLALELIVDPAYEPRTSALKPAHGTPPIPFDLRESPEPADLPTADPAIGLPFNSGSGDGDLTAPLVNVNRGLDADYDALAHAHIEVKDAVVLVRYGAQFRGLLAERAQANGAAGVIFYSDPRDDGAARGSVYPAGPWRPFAAVQRGSVGVNVRIPTLPISLRAAQTLIAHLHGPTSAPQLVHLVVKLERTQKTLWNTIARLRGTNESQSVMLGAHRDAWVYGVGDNGAGVTTMLEVARGLGYLARTGWRPKRTILIAGWDGEEIGLAGSRAYVRGHAQELRRGCIAYLNADENVTGPAFGADAASAIAATIVDASRDIVDPGTNRTSLYDRWLRQTRTHIRGAITPAVTIPGGGSDHEPFLFEIGIPIANIEFSGPFGVYHSSYDTVRYATTFSDPGFALHRTIAQLYGVVALRLADAETAPYTFAGYARVLQSGYMRLAADAQRAQNSLDLAVLKRAIERFAQAARRSDSGYGGNLDRTDRLLVAVHELDALAYGANGYESSVFPRLGAAIKSNRAPEINAAVFEAVGSVSHAAHLIVSK
ncbi:MAG: hypothetical protein NVS2B17_23540 [Candidatus Velthaea sp.]